MSDGEKLQIEEDIIAFAYRYQTLDIDLIATEIPEAKQYSQDEIEALVFCEYYNKDKENIK